MTLQPRMPNATRKTSVTHGARHNRLLLSAQARHCPSTVAGFAYITAIHGLPEQQHKSWSKARIIPHMAYAAALVCLATVGIIRWQPAIQNHISTPTSIASLMACTSARQPPAGKYRTNTIPLKSNAIKSRRTEFYSTDSNPRQHTNIYQSYHYAMRS